MVEVVVGVVPRARGLGGTPIILIGNIGHMKHIQELVAILNGVDSRVHQDQDQIVVKVVLV